MATTPEGAAILERHRQAQAVLSARSMRSAIALWPVLTSDDFSTTVPRWIAAMLALIRRDKAASAALARVYLAAYRLQELGGVNPPFDFRDEVEVNEEQIISSLLYMGPGAYDRARDKAGVDRLLPTSKALQNVVEAHARSVQRHVSNGMREVVDDVIQRDPARRGYMRLTDGDPCFFCAMLASRGPVYEEDSFDDSDPRFQGAGEHKVHDGCGCSLVPIYGPPVAMAGFKAWDALWQDVTKGSSGAGAIKEFRRAYEDRRDGRRLRR